VRAAWDQPEPSAPASRRRSCRSLVPFAVDEAHFASVGDQDLVAALLEQTTHPGRVGAGLDRYAHRGYARKAPLESLLVGGDAALLDHLAVFAIQ
jgi:hypothetical protein